MAYWNDIIGEEGQMPRGTEFTAYILADERLKRIRADLDNATSEGAKVVEVATSDLAFVFAEFQAAYEERHGNE
jgi:hypothetical protein